MTLRTLVFSPAQITVPADLLGIRAARNTLLALAGLVSVHDQSPCEQSAQR